MALIQPKLNAIVLYVRNLDTSAAFYRDHLGIDAPIQDIEGERIAISQNIQGCEIVLVEHSQPKSGNSPIPVFTIDEGIDDIIDALAAAGVPIITPTRSAGGGWVADIADPDDHTVSFWQDRDAPRRK